MSIFGCSKKEKQVSVFDRIAEASVREEQERIERLGFNRLHKGQDMFRVLGEGDERATAVVWEVMRSRIDPDNRHSLSLELVEALDLIGIYGKNIVVLHDTVCGGDVEKTAAVLKAWWMFWLSKDEILAAVRAPSEQTINPTELLERVRRVLPDFKSHKR